METFKERRKRAGFGQLGKLAKASGISETRLYSIECGQQHIRSLKPNEQRKLASLLGYTNEELRSKVKGIISPCHSVKMKREEIEQMLKDKYGEKLRPITKDAKPPVNYMLTTNDSYDDGIEIGELIGENVMNSD